MTRVTRDYDKGHDHMIEIRWQSLPPKKVWQTSLGPEQLYKFESILFDLESLQPVSVMQSASYNLAEARQSAITVAHNLIQTMVNERIIKKQDPSTAPPKAF